MVPEIFGLTLLAASAGAADVADSARAAAHGLSAGLGALSGAADSVRAAAGRALASGPTFQPADRSVSNWRDEAATHLDTLQLKHPPAAEGDWLNTPRCVKLNNYWCVKRAGWAGEIAADNEGHVAFGSAVEGATVAAMLLRRYYLGYKLHSAKAILSRWAPAQCGPPVARKAVGVAAPSLANLANLATQGIGNTLRARWLATHKPGLTGAAGAAVRKKEGMIISATMTSASIAPLPAIPAPRRSIAPARKVSLMRAPEIAVGMGERIISSPQFKIDLFDAPRPAVNAPGESCGAELQRIRNYAVRAIEGFASGPDEDLKLFSPEGAPGANLAFFLRNMAGVEIGPHKVKMEMIVQAVALEAARTLALQAAAGSPPATR